MNLFLCYFHIIWCWGISAGNIFSSFCEHRDDLVHYRADLLLYLWLIYLIVRISNILKCYFVMGLGVFLASSYLGEASLHFNRGEGSRWKRQCSLVVHQVFPPVYETSLFSVTSQRLCLFWLCVLIPFYFVLIFVIRCRIINTYGIITFFIFLSSLDAFFFCTFLPNLLAFYWVCSVLKIYSPF